ncbi:histone-lysine N-methyltransferase SETMAR [Trichonephila clavipes]|nr:histone-lysine N-methyltransferase SETMAR [Trichonephila clavipes]
MSVAKSPRVAGTIFTPSDSFEFPKSRTVWNIQTAKLQKSDKRCELQGVKNGSQQREHSVHFTGFFIDKDENASQVAEIANGVYGADSVTINHVQSWFRRFRSGIFNVKDAPRSGRPVVENVGKITEIIEVDRHVSSRSIPQKLKIDHKTVLNHLHKVGFKKKLHVWCTPINTKKT